MSPDPKSWQSETEWDPGFLKKGSNRLLPSPPCAVKASFPHINWTSFKNFFAVRDSTIWVEIIVRFFPPSVQCDFWMFHWAAFAKYFIARMRSLNKKYRLKMNPKRVIFWQSRCCSFGRGNPEERDLHTAGRWGGCFTDLSILAHCAHPDDLFAKFLEVRGLCRWEGGHRSQRPRSPSSRLKSVTKYLANS